jgi:hypothetical protein
MPIRKGVAQSLRDFLNQSSAPKVIFCEHCGVQMQHRTMTFEFDGERWDIPLPFCPYCTAAQPPKSDAA